MAKLIIITGPSGVGKGTIEIELFKDPQLNLAFSVSATTREKRANEIEGQHYYFISTEEFEAKIAKAEFIEYSKHFTYYYGTLKAEIAQKLALGKNVLVEVETTGAINIINHYQATNQLDQLITIFVLPPSLKELKRRILGRKSENFWAVRRRLKKARKELKYKIYFNHHVKNDNIKEAIDQIKQIIIEGTSNAIH